MRYFLLSVLLGVLMPVFTFAEEESKEKIVYEINVNREIDNTSRLYLSEGLKKASALHADAVLLHLNTYGGLLDAADSMRTAILYSPIPVYAFIDNNAASAGALISIACKKIYMRKGANIGAATVVNQTGAALPDKYQSYMRSLIRSTAEAQGRDTIIQGNDTVYKWKRDPRIAEAMVDDRIIVPNLVDSGKVLTLTANEAVKWGYCDGIAESTDQVITEYLGYKDYKVITYEPSWYENLKGFLMNPVLQGILIMLIIGGIYFEMQSPGLGFPSVVAIAAAVLYFAPLYLDGFAEHWEILIFVAGLVLLAIEIFVIPGFGVTGIAGILCILAGLTLSLVNNHNFDFQPVSTKDFTRALMTVVCGIAAGFLFMLWLSSRIGERGLLRKVALKADLSKSVSMAYDLSRIVGEEGEAATVLRPSGKIFIHGELYDGVSESGFIERGEKIRVIRFENSQFYVERV
ncbi:NfeD family protein [Parabacteroides pacaensis]|uniref:NfeD family protein n=1 Tax=Parabacteroides pacaensis TaxID=2086575 RepID=UPI000D0EFB54|nr:NfeD family protein [Parabacteroides pacaensis]